MPEAGDVVSAGVGFAVRVGGRCAGDPGVQARRDSVCT